MGNISQGNLNISTSENYKGNFIEIKTSLDNISQSLSEVFLEIRDATSQVSNGADQVSSTSQVLSKGVADQANSIEELSTSYRKNK